MDSNLPLRQNYCLITALKTVVSRTRAYHGNSFFSIINELQEECVKIVSRTYWEFTFAVIVRILGIVIIHKGIQNTC
jgi:hypothetical protein